MKVIATKLGLNMGQALISLRIYLLVQFPSTCQAFCVQVQAVF